MGIRGDFGKLTEVLERIASIPGQKLALTKRLGAAAVTRVQQEFEKAIDPQDRPWLPVRRRRRNTGAIQPLRDTGRLMNSFSSQSALKASESGFVLGTNVKYAAVHQFGATIKAREQTLRFNKRGRFVKKNRKRIAKTMNVRVGERSIPARPMLPLAGLGPTWQAKLVREAREWMRDVMGQGAVD